MKNHAKTAVHAVLKRWGSSATRQRIWDDEFAAGRWDHLEQPSTDLAYQYIAKYADGGSILDLGCGTGEIGMTLPTDEYQHYTGVDVSAVALEEATAESGRHPERKRQNEYVVADIGTFVPARKYDAVLLMEMLYYFSPRQIKPLMRRYSQHLTDDGVMIAQLHDGEKYASIVRLIAKNFTILDRAQPEDGKTILLVFR